MSLNVVILAAGRGTRMCSQLPKVLHPVGGMPMLMHCINTARQLNATQINVVYGYGGEKLQTSIQADDVHWCLQKEQLGTGHAVEQCVVNLKKNLPSKTIVLYADVPLLQASTCLTLLESTAHLSVLTSITDNPSGYGRIVRDADGSITQVIEEKDASPEIQEIKEVNSGIICADTHDLIEWLARIENDNAQQEYYLTDIIACAVADNKRVDAFQCEDATDVLGINDRVQLAQVEACYQQRQRHQLMMKGVTLKDPNTVYIEGQIEVANDIVIEPCVTLRGDVILEENVHIGMNTVIIDAHIGKDSNVHAHSYIEQAEIGQACEIGPYARLRPDTILADEVKIGNFVEIKKTHIDTGTKINHLSYIGDAQVGHDTNIGAGTISCNYDGANKHRTIIGDHVFIGSDTQLVAPVIINSGATIGAGSTITSDAAADKLTLSRSKQKTIDHWQRPTKKNKT